MISMWCEILVRVSSLGNCAELVCTIWCSFASDWARRRLMVSVLTNAQEEFVELGCSVGFVERYHVINISATIAFEWWVFDAKVLGQTCDNSGSPHLCAQLVWYVCPHVPEGLDGFVIYDSCSPWAMEVYDVTNNLKLLFLGDWGRCGWCLYIVCHICKYCDPM